MPNFDPVARSYRLLEHLVFGEALERVRLRFVDRLPRSGEALILGDGDGRFLKAALAARPGLQFTSMDSSAAMLGKAAARLGKGELRRVRFIHGDARELEEAGAGYDVVVTQFFLDCFSEEELRLLVPRIASRLRPGGRWIVGEFAVPREGLVARFVAGALLRVMYLFFRVATGLRASQLPNHERVVEKAGLTEIDTARWRRGLLVASVWRKGGIGS